MSPQRIHYSRGRKLCDAKPAQHQASDFDGFVQALERDRAPLKDGAAYICGPLNGDGRRCAKGALPRAWVAVDLDRIEASILADVQGWFGRLSAICWPTHRSTPEAPRLRVIIELAGPASRDQCIAIGALLEQQLRDEFGDGVLLDVCTFRPEQPVHVPPSGVLIRRFNGAPLAVPADSTAATKPACTEEDRGILKPSSVSSVSSVQGVSVLVGGVAWTIPGNTVPTEAGQRNSCLFLLARHVKAMPQPPTKEELRHIVGAWHGLALPVIQTQDFAVSFNEFMNGYEKVKQPHGAIMDAIIENLASTPIPAGIERLGYGASGNLLVRICAALQERSGDGPFFLAARKAGELLGEPYTDANRMMQMLARDCVIQVVTKGAGRSASRYRFDWRAEPDLSA